MSTDQDSSGVTSEDSSPIDYYAEGGPLYTRPSTREDYPTLQPALRLVLNIGPMMNVGSLSRGTPLTVIPMVGGRLTSEEGFEVNIDVAVVGNGIDHVHYDPDGRRMRLKTDLVMGDDVDGPSIAVHYDGIMDITNDMRRIIGRSENSRSTEFGTSFIHVTFETGAMQYKSLEQGVFVGSGRIIMSGEGPKVEYRISKVCKGPGPT